MPTMGNCQSDFFCYVHFCIIIFILFFLDIQINILKMSTCLVVLSENYKRDFDWFGSQVVGARHGGYGEICTHTSGRWDTEGQNKAVGTSLAPQLWELFCLLEPMFQTHTHSTPICLESPMYQARCQIWQWENEIGYFSSGILDLEPKTVNNRLNLYYMLW